LNATSSHSSPQAYFMLHAAHKLEIWLQINLYLYNVCPISCLGLLPTQCLCLRSIHQPSISTSAMSSSTKVHSPIGVVSRGEGCENHGVPNVTPHVRSAGRRRVGTFCVRAAPTNVKGHPTG
jgi:hypothetical protein